MAETAVEVERNPATPSSFNSSRTAAGTSPGNPECENAEFPGSFTYDEEHGVGTITVDGVSVQLPMFQTR